MIDGSLRLKEYETLRSQVLDSLQTSFNVWRLGLWGTAALTALVFLGWVDFKRAFTKHFFTLCSYEVPYVFLVGLLLFALGLSIAVVAVSINRGMEEERDRIGGYLVMFHESLYGNRGFLPGGWHYWNRFEKWSGSAVLESLKPKDINVPTTRIIEATTVVWTLPLALFLFGIVIFLFYTHAVSGESSKAWVSPLVFFVFLLILYFLFGIFCIKKAAEGKKSIAYWSARWLQVAVWARSQRDIIDRFEVEFFKRSLETFTTGQGAV